MSRNKSYKIATEDETPNVNEGAIAYQASLFDPIDIYGASKRTDVKVSNIATGLQPIVKWPGGKEKELKYILPNAPVFRRFYEPFVGGGSVFMAIEANEYYINDFSSELIALYRNIANSDADFFRYADMIDQTWANAQRFFKDNITLVDIYLEYRDGKITKENLKDIIHDFHVSRNNDIIKIIGEELASYPYILPKEIETNLYRKMVRMQELEIERHTLPTKDLLDNVETAIKSAVYMNYRHMYNDESIQQYNPGLYSALFFFIRNYAYSGMFRYSSNGDFNVPYGGIAYNSKFMAKKLDYYHSNALLKHFDKTHIYNLDFEQFLRETNPSEDDFVFLDPPYDSEFSTYAQNVFTRDDQERLAHYLIYECKAKWMLIIKNTDFIYNLYNKEGVNIQSFDKKYLVSFMNRNNKKVTHLLITNY